MKKSSIAARIPVVSFGILIAWGLSGCGTRPLYPPKLSPAERETLLDGITNLATPNIPPPAGTDRAVRIFAPPIQLPESDVGWEQHEYSMYVWANHPSYPGVGIKELIDRKLLELDIIGLGLLPRDPRAHDPQKAARELESQSFAAARRAVFDGQVLELVVRAGDIRGPIRIAAWFPSEYRMALAQHRFGLASGTSQISASNTPEGTGTWSDQAFIPIRSGDLTTKIEIVDQIEARAAFGDEFPRHFYIGRIYLRNTNSNKKLIVYTTSMRAPVYLYRRSDPAEIMEGDAKESVAPKNRQTRVYTPPAHSLCKDDEPCRQKNTPPQPVPATYANSPAAVISRLVADIQAYADKTLTESIIEKEPDAPLRESRQKLKSWLEKEKKNLADRRDDTAKRIKDTPIPPFGDAKLSKKLKDELVSAWLTLRDGPVEGVERACADFATRANTSLGASAAAPFIAQARALADLRSKHDELKRQHDFLDDRSAPDQDLAVRLLSRALADGILSITTSASPFAETSGLSAGLVDKTSPVVSDQRATQRVLFSQDPGQQRCLDHLGYIWRDSSRPLTFQAVLNSLILTQDQAVRTQWVKFFDLAGRVAGGLIALGPVVDAFERESYARAVAFYASVISPEIADLLLEDIKKHVTNLGAMSMDTVMVIPPRGVVDRYVFFSRGPVYNHPDEFDQHSPAYIVKVLGDEVAVQAELVDNDSTAINGEGQAAALVREFNTGSPSAASSLALQTQIKIRAAQAELAIALGKAEKALIRRKAATAEADRTAAENDARRIVRDFRLEHEKLGDTAFADLFGQYGLKGDDSPPELETLPALQLIAGTVGATKPLPVKDDRTPVGELVVKATASGENLAWLVEPSPASKTLSYRADASGASLSGTPPAEEKRNVRITIKDHTGNESTVEQAVTLVPAAPVFSLDEGTLVKNEDTGAITLAFPTNSIPTLSITLALDDSASEGWTLELSGTNELAPRPSRVPFNLAAPGRLNASVALDASLLKDSTGATVTSAVLTIRFRQGTREIHVGTLTVTTE